MKFFIPILSAPRGKASEVGPFFPNAPFLTAWVDFQWRSSQLRQFLARMEQQIDELEKHVDAEIFGFSFKAPAWLIDKEERGRLSQNKKEMEYLLGSMAVIMLVSILEISIEQFCAALQKSKELKLSWTDIRGKTFLDRFKSYFEKAGGIDLGISPLDWEGLRNLIFVRNVFAHALGEMQENATNRMENIVTKESGLDVVDGNLHARLVFCYNKFETVRTAMVSGIGPFVEAEEKIVREQWHTSQTKRY